MGRIAFFCAVGVLSLRATTYTVSSGGNLQATINSAAAGDTVQVQPGAYSTSDVYFHVDKPLTLVSLGNSSNTVLGAGTGNSIGLAITSSNVTVRGFTVNSNGGYGVVVQASSGVTLQDIVAKPNTGVGGAGFQINGASSFTLDGCSLPSSMPNQIGINLGANSNFVAIRNCTIASAQHAVVVQNSSNVLLYNVTVNGSGFDGILLQGTTNSVVDSCIINSANANGILLDALNGGSNNNLVINNTVQSTGTGHAFAVKNSNYNVLSGNTVNASGFHAVELIGASFNRVENNRLTNFQSDGVVLTTEPGSGNRSLNNYVGKNIVASNGFTAGRSSGTGIWMDGGANGTYVFGNDESGDVEGGITSFNASNNYINGNSVHGNGQAGIFVWNAETNYPRPQFNVIHSNWVYDNPSNAQILIRGGDYNDIAYNYLAMSSKGSGGIFFLSYNGSGGSTGNLVYQNIVNNVAIDNSVGSDTTNTRFFRNRYFNLGNSFSIPNADVKWDDNVYLGGNYWSGQAGNGGSIPNGNPSIGTPWYNFIIDANAGTRNGPNGPYIDRYPFANENLGKPYSITVVRPVAGQIMAAGSQKTISWISQACVLVDIAYTSSAGSGTIVTNYPNTGYYNWTVPAGLGPAADYTVAVTCKNSAGGGTGVSSSSPAFTVASNALTLLTPGPDQPANGGAALRVSWRKSSSVSAVNVFLKYDGGGYTQYASNVTNDYVDITLPSISSNKVSVMIQSASGAAGQDSVDGYFMVRGGSGAFTSLSGATNTLLVGDIVNLEWVSPPNSYYVDLDLVDAESNTVRTETVETSARPTELVDNLPDYGHYRWFVPELWMSGGSIRLTFRDQNGAQISQINSGPIDIRYTAATGNLTPFYRLYSDVTKEHLYTTDANEYNVLATRNWAQEGPVGQILNGPRAIGGVNAKPFYRLYNSSSLQHLWTTDRNEYFTLREEPNWSAENFVGYIYPTQVSGTIGFYRLSYNYLPIHLWTTDYNEYQTLPSRGWTQEGVAGYLFPTGAAQLSNQSGSPQAVTSAAPGQSLRGAGAMAAAFVSSALPNRQRPTLKAIANGASFRQGAIVPGETISLFGRSLGPASGAGLELRGQKTVAHELQGVQVLFDGQPAPVIYVSGDQLKAVVPNEVAGKKAVKVEVDYSGSRSAALQVPVTAADPGLFTADASGVGQGAVLNEDHSTNSADAPAGRGSLVTLVLTGAGSIAPNLATGELPAAGDLPKLTLPAEVQIGGLPAQVEFAGAMPGLPGVAQVRARVPSAAPAGASVPVQVLIGGIASQDKVTMAVQ
jgi:uncharacterized protein (TIGR03437 family)